MGVPVAAFRCPTLETQKLANCKVQPGPRLFKPSRLQIANPQMNTDDSRAGNFALAPAGFLGREIKT